MTGKHNLPFAFHNFQCEIIRMELPCVVPTANDRAGTSYKEA